MRDRLAELREEWYSESETQPETDEEIVDDELLALEVLFRSRGVTVAGSHNVTVSDQEGEDPDRGS
ncbi:MAG: hypothetical protein RBS34_13815 [Desulfofustis sp.]|jgi:hypothetical protein|nr:hypothetical protein [Desulfofustis sp.]